jgi:hypothetical protein
MLNLPRSLVERYLYGGAPQAEETPLMEPAISDSDLQSDMAEAPVDPAADIRRRYLAAQEQGQQEESLANIGAFMDNVNANFMRARGINASPAALPRVDRDAPVRLLERQLRMEDDARKAAAPAGTRPGARAKSTDPKSPESLLAQARVRSILAGQLADEDIANVTEASEDAVLKYGTLARGHEVNREGQLATTQRSQADREQRAMIAARVDAREWAQMSQEERLAMLRYVDAKEAREAARAERKEETTEREVLKLSERLENMPGIAKDLGILSKYAAEPDVPGVGATGALPAKMLSDDGIRVRQAVRGVVGALLKEQSGAAVSEPEIDRKLEELGMGKFAPDREFRLGLSRLLTNTDEALRAKEAGASPEAVKRFRARGGTTSADLPPPVQKPPNPKSGEPRIVNTKGMKPGDLVKSLQEGETVRVPMGQGQYQTVRRKNGQLIRVKE